MGKPSKRGCRVRWRQEGRVKGKKEEEKTGQE